MALRSYKMDFGWEIGIPEEWIAEKKEEGSYIFYPNVPDDETTIYATALHSEDHKTLTPEYVMRDAFEKSIPENAQEVSIITSVHCKAFFLIDANGVYRIGAGFFTDGDLLSLNVYSKSEEKARAATDGFSKVKLVRGGKNAF